MSDLTTTVLYFILKCHYLIKDVDEQILEDKQDAVGRLFKPAAEEMSIFFKQEKFQTRFCKNGHRKPPTVVAIAPNNIHIFSGGKDGSVFKWDSSNLSNMRRIASAYGGRSVGNFI